MLLNPPLLAGWLFFWCAVVPCIFLRITMVQTCHVGMTLNLRLTFGVVSKNRNICVRCVYSVEPDSVFWWEGLFYACAHWAASCLFFLSPGLGQLMELPSLPEGHHSDERETCCPHHPHTQSPQLFFRGSDMLLAHSFQCIYFRTSSELVHVPNYQVSLVGSFFSCLSVINLRCLFFLLQKLCMFIVET